MSARLAVVGVYDELEAGHKLSEHQVGMQQEHRQQMHSMCGRVWVF